MNFEKAQALKRSLIPKTGFNVVGIDSFELPDEALYFIAHVETRKEAEEIAALKKAKGIHVFIYHKNTL
jgi:hypothetical protein